MSTTIAPNIELPLGYAIVDRLGAGGYGEVWKATAPGGVEKAIKIVFGHCDEGMAERELKSLERIKRVRHPFVLSIERFEIVNNRLVIVTELADMSLSDAFQKCLSEGLSGIPREQLIGYLWDAAEALDCLVEQHALQHLDIKPENLLVVGDHIKVADFGLVKELASKTLNSMMGGMTPIYSAPEIYDDNPSAYSDQYSLAIVYQYLLTGVLPFPGRTPAQLAKQHTLAEPNLKCLGEVDRRVVRKALEKDPAARFSSCREFIGALQSVDQTPVTRTRTRGDETSTPSSNLIQSDDTKSVAFLDTKHRTEAVSTAATQVLSEIENVDNPTIRQIEKQKAAASSLSFPRVDFKIEDVEVPVFEASTKCEPVPTLFIGVGGIGISMLREIRKRAQSRDQDAIAWLAIDTERETLKTVLTKEKQGTWSSTEVLHIPLRRPKQYREASQDLLRWVSRRWLYNIPRSLQTRGFRPLGRIAIVDHAEAVLSALQTRSHWLTEHAENSQPIRVVLLAGMSGGTGGGTIIDLAQAVRSVFQTLSHEVIIHGVLGSTFHDGSTDSLAAANMYSLLTELSHTQQTGNCGDSPPPGAASLYELPKRPFDEIYTVAIPTQSDRTDRDLTLQSIANYLLLETKGDAGPGMAAIRRKPEDSADKNLFRIFSCINLGQLSDFYVYVHQRQLINAIVEYWVKQDSENTGSDAKIFNSHAKSKFAQDVLAHFPDTSIRAHDITDDEVPSNQTNMRTANIQGAAIAFLQFLETFEIQDDMDHSPLDNADVISASKRIVARVCTVLGDNEQRENELGQILSEIMIEEVNESTKASGAIDPVRLASTAASLLEASPLDCPYQRRTMLISPREQEDSKLLEAFDEKCPKMAYHRMEVAETHLVHEGCNLHPLHLGARLADYYPDIDEAAGRLHARNDLSWRDLRSNS